MVESTPRQPRSRFAYSVPRYPAMPKSKIARGIAQQFQIQNEFTPFQTIESPWSIWILTIEQWFQPLKFLNLELLRYRQRSCQYCLSAPPASMISSGFESVVFTFMMWEYWLFLAWQIVRTRKNGAIGASSTHVWRSRSSLHILVPSLTFFVLWYYYQLVRLDRPLVWDTLRSRFLCQLLV